MTQALRVAVVDDEPLARLGVTARLAALPDCTLVGEFTDAQSAWAGLATASPQPTPAVDVLIVDVQMPGDSGLELLARWPQPQRPVAIVLTAHAEYALRGFELQVVDYLLKPIDDARFAEALARARQALRLRSLPEDASAPDAWLQRFELREGERRVFVDAQRVRWIEADADYAVLHTEDGRRHLLREPLHRLADRLDPAQFLRVHRSAIVRLDQIAEMQALSNRDALLRLKDGTPVRASRTHVPALMALLRPR
ncbi:LytR/AlgR family response regulator transcription factor [Roseateles sp.]|jgi:two-component system LytT family response regulator|uniref:LytR/AlgR family response regulator transcription factor n=1 Tax=Roseateles sp. TaxID=1971397 RepID=UPI0037C710D7